MLRFGLFLSQARKSLAQVEDEFALAEDLGFDTAYLVDHLTPTAGSPDDPFLESWTLLADLAARTRRIRLGVLVTSNTFRHPSVLLKSAVTVDHISAGRLILGLGTGWHEDEHRRYGIELPPPAGRVDRFEEAVEVMTRLMAQDRTTFHGRYYHLEDAPLQPRPVQQPRIPILIAAHRPRMLRIAARYADQWDTFAEMSGTATDGVSSGLAERVRALDEACRAIGRDPAEIRRSTWTDGDVLRSEATYVAFVRHHLAIGFTDFATELPEPEHLPVLRRVAAEIIPALRAGERLA
jgi:alkanesulfonate monooxygenase SsuD/methylene tetrahydromethanopterin reductase-like flavin-dependent oxidoreductase (luciferase family)